MGFEQQSGGDVLRGLLGGGAAAPRQTIDLQHGSGFAVHQRGVYRRAGRRWGGHQHGRTGTFDNIFVERLWRSVKHEDVYLKGYATMGELRLGLGEYFTFYNIERPHQGLP